jgi:hypothetical protein
MGVPSSEVGYTSATTGRGDHAGHKGQVVALEKKSLEQVFHILTVELIAENKTVWD